MTTDEALSELSRFFDAFPSYRGWFNKNKRDDTTRNIWLRVIARCELQDCKTVIDGMIAGEIAIPESYDRDRLPQTIRSECRSIAGKRRDQVRMDRLHEAANEKVSESEMSRFPKAMRQARRAGAMLQEGHLTEDENEIYVAMLQEWCRNGGAIPLLPADTPDRPPQVTESDL